MIKAHSSGRMVSNGISNVVIASVHSEKTHLKKLMKIIISSSTAESLLMDTPRKGHCIKYLSTMDKTKSPNFIPPINIMQLESLKRGQSLCRGQTT